MINIFISSLVGSIIVIGNGFILNSFFFKKKINEFNVYKDSILGFVFIGFLSLLINFFFPIDKNISSFFLAISIFAFAYFFFKIEKKKHIFIVILYLTLTTFLIISHSNINRPDAGLYHLPFIKILNESKLIFGLSNLHFRFGQTSIFQYISALHVNWFFKEEFLNIPLATLPAFYFLYLFKNFKNSFKIENKKFIIFIFLIAIFSLYSFNRFSGLGNDGPAHIFFFILIIQLFKIKDIKLINSNEYYTILIISLFLIMLKPLMVFVIIIPFVLLYFNKTKQKLLLDKKIIFCTFFISLWFLKNIFLSSCIIFPIKQTCLNNLKYSNIEIVEHASKEAEAWAKGYPDSKVKKGFDHYNSNFNWVETWSKNHLKKIAEKISPLIILIIFLILHNFIKYKDFKLNSLEKMIKEKNTFYIIIFLTLYIFVWFLKFPVYRFGLSFLSSIIILIFIYFFIDNSKKFYSKKFLSIFLVIIIAGFYMKNINRIINNYNQEYRNSPWPKIYTMKANDLNKAKIFKKLYDENNNFLYFYSGGEECMYSQSPCSSYFFKNIKKDIIFGYKVYFF